MEWNTRAQQILDKINGYRNDEEGWKVAKKSPEVTVWSKSSPDWSGTLYKVEGEVNADPETVFQYIDPSPSSPRSKWDKAIKELQSVTTVAENISVVRTITHDAFGGLIASRDFTDLVINEKTDNYLATNEPVRNSMLIGYHPRCPTGLSTQSCRGEAEGVEHPDCPPSSDYIRGKNYPCSITCYRIPGVDNKTKVVSYIQTDLGGMLPQALVENALPSNQVNFFVSLRKALQDDNRWINGHE